MFHLLAPSFSNLLSNTRKNPVLTTKTHSESRLGTGLLSSSPQPIFPAVSLASPGSLSVLSTQSSPASSSPGPIGHPAFPCPRGHSNVHHLQLYMHSVSFPREIYRGQLDLHVHPWGPRISCGCWLFFSGDIWPVFLFLAQNILQFLSARLETSPG